MKKYIFLGLLGLVLNGCSLTDNDSPDVAFIIIEEADLTTTPEQGLPVHQIEDVWVYANEVALGVFTLPAKIPLIPTGEDVQIRINAGVKPNGSKNESILYPFYNAIRFDYNFAPEEELMYSPTFEVNDEAVFDIIDGFENGTVFNQDLDGNLETLIIRSAMDNNGGNFCGFIELANDRRVIEFTTQTEFSSDNNAGGATFLEFDFKGTTELGVGYIINNGFQDIEDYVAIFVPQDDWIRVYIDYTSILTLSSVEGYKIKFYAEHTAGSTSEIYLDNVKLVHF